MQKLIQSLDFINNGYSKVPVVPSSTINPHGPNLQNIFSEDCQNHIGTKRPMQCLVVQESYKNYKIISKAPCVC